jgi:hypothetical protein
MSITNTMPETQQTARRSSYTKEELISGMIFATEEMTKIFPSRKERFDFIDQIVTKRIITGEITTPWQVTKAIRQLFRV